MKYSNTILDKVANEHTYLHNICGYGFLKAMYDLFHTTDGDMDNDCAKSFMKFFAEMNDIQWEDAVEYLYYIMVEAIPKFYENNSGDLDWSSINPESNYAYKKFLEIKGNEKYAGKALFELFCKRANIDMEDSVREAVIDAYGWKRVLKTIVTFVIEEYLSVEERYEESEVLPYEDVVSDEIETPSESVKEHKDVGSVEVAITDELGKYGKKAVKAICIEDGTELVFSTRTEMAKELGIGYGCITNCLRGQRNSCRSKKDGKKYKFERLGKNKKHGKTLMVDSATKKIVRTYSKATDASKEWGINYDKLQGILKNATPEHHLYEGYEWWRESDYNKQYKVA